MHFWKTPKSTKYEVQSTKVRFTLFDAPYSTLGYILASP